MNLTERERNVIALAFGNLERTIASLPGKSVKWTPYLGVGEVAALRRRLLGTTGSPVKLVADFERNDGPKAG